MATQTTTKKPETTKALAVRQNIQTVTQWLSGAGQKEIQLQIPKGTIDANRFMRLAYQILNDPNLQNCTADSLKNAILESAALGLDCDGLLGHAYVIAFGNKALGKNDKGEPIKEAVMMIGYKGFGVLAMRSRDLNRLAKPPAAFAVRANDTFEPPDFITGECIFRPALQNRGDVIGAIAVAEFETGSRTVIWLPKEEIDAIMQRSPAVRAGMMTPWKTDYAAMAEKTALRQLCHRGKVTLTGMAAEAVAREVYREEVIDVTPEPVLQTPRRLSESGTSKTITSESGSSTDAKNGQSGGNSAPDQTPTSTEQTGVSPKQDSSVQTGNTTPAESKAATEPENAGSGDNSAPPPPLPEQPESDVGPEDGYERVLVTRKIDKSSGTNKKGKWTRYAAQINGNWYVTFDTNFGELLDDCQRAGKEVLIKAEYNDQYKSYNLIDVQAV